MAPRLAPLELGRRGEQPENPWNFSGADGNRTHDPLLAKQVRSVRGRPLKSAVVRYFKGLCPETSVAVGTHIGTHRAGHILRRAEYETPRHVPNRASLGATP